MITKETQITNSTRFYQPIIETFHYSLLRTQELLKNQSFIERTSGLAIKIFAAMDLAYGRGIEDRLITQALQALMDFSDLFSTYQQVKFWANPLSSSTIDKEAFISSIPYNSPVRTAVFEKALDDVLKKPVYSENHALELVKENLRQTLPSCIEQIEKKPVIIQKKVRTPKDFIKNSLWTVALVGSNILALDSWKVINLSPIMQKGSIQIASTVFKSRIKMIVRGSASLGWLLTIGFGSYEIYKHLTTKAETSIWEKKNEILTTITASLDLVSLGVPILFTVNPAVAVGLAITAKGFGMVSACLKS